MATMTTRRRKKERDNGRGAMESDQAVEAIPAAVEPFEGLESLRNERDRLCEFYAGSPPPSGIRQSEWTLRWTCCGGRWSGCGTPTLWRS